MSFIDNQTVVIYSDEHVNHGFDNDGPFFYVKPELEDAIPRHIKCDVTVGYAHDPEYVNLQLERLQRVLPLPIPLTIAVLSRDGLGGWNGTYYNESRYHGKDRPTTYYGLIVLVGKRIPIHPAMTRYLCAHEYGHGVQYVYERLHGLKAADAMESDYIKTFRPEAKMGYGPGKWHNNPGELIANDFRILVAETETEFWPHPGHRRPEDVPGLREFWQKAAREIRNGAPEGPMFHVSEEMPQA